MKTSEFKINCSMFYLFIVSIVSNSIIIFYVQNFDTDESYACAERVLFYACAICIRVTVQNDGHYKTPLTAWGKVTRGALLACTHETDRRAMEAKRRKTALHPRVSPANNTVAGPAAAGTGVPLVFLLVLILGTSAAAALECPDGEYSERRVRSLHAVVN